MDDTPPIPTSNTAPRLAGAAPWPVLAQLSDVSSDTSASRIANQAGGTNYRFDPPQAAGSKEESAIYKDIRRDGGTIDIQTGSKTFRRHQPHVFERGRAGARQSKTPRRESPILPLSNPFSIPRKRLVDSLAPAVRFFTMVGLFAAAGTWIQMMGHRTPAVPDSLEVPKTAAQQTVAPAKNTAERSVPTPTAAGPLETNPQSGARVGRIHGDDFANQNKSAAACPPDRPVVMPPHFLIGGGLRLPQVQTAELPKVGGGDAPARLEDSPTNGESDEGAAVARYPGFESDIPTR